MCALIQLSEDAASDLGCGPSDCGRRRPHRHTMRVRPAMVLMNVVGRPLAVTARVA
jgi:hypothetical protein